MTNQRIGFSAHRLRAGVLEHPETLAERRKLEKHVAMMPSRDVPRYLAKAALDNTYKALQVVGWLSALPLLERMVRLSGDMLPLYTTRHTNHGLLYREEPEANAARDNLRLIGGVA